RRSRGYIFHHFPMADRSFSCCNVLRTRLLRGKIRFLKNETVVPLRSAEREGPASGSIFAGKNGARCGRGRCIRRTRSARRTRSHAVSAVRPLVRIAAQPRWRKGGPGWGWCSRSVCAVRPLVRFAPPPRESPALLNPSPPEGEGGARD